MQLSDTLLVPILLWVERFFMLELVLSIFVLHFMHFIVFISVWENSGWSRPSWRLWSELLVATLVWSSSILSLVLNLSGTPHELLMVNTFTLGLSCSQTTWLNLMLFKLMIVFTTTPVSASISPMSLPRDVATRSVSLSSLMLSITGLISASSCCRCSYIAIVRMIWSWPFLRHIGLVKPAPLHKICCDFIR